MSMLKCVSYGTCKSTKLVATSNTELAMLILTRGPGESVLVGQHTSSLPSRRSPLGRIGIEGVGLDRNQLLALSRSESQRHTAATGLPNSS